MIEKVSLLLTLNKSSYLLKTPLVNLEKASFSSILTLAAFMVWKFPHLCPRENVATQKIDQETKGQFPPEIIGEHPYFQYWCHFIVQAFLSKSAINIQKIVYVELKLDEKHKKYIESGMKGYLIEHELLKEEINLTAHDKLTKLFKLAKIIPSNKRVAIFNYSKDQLDEINTDPRIQIDSLIIGQLFLNEEWFVFNIEQKQLPSKQEIHTFNCVILTGSSFSVLSERPLIENSALFLKQALNKSPKLTIIAICFGHQLISKNFKALVETKNRINGVEEIIFQKPILQRYAFFEPILSLNKERLDLWESHGDHVEEVPAGFDLIGRSQSCKVEGLISKDGRILTIQFHCEFLSKHLHNYRCRWNRQHSKDVKLTQFEPAKDEAFHVQSSLAVRKTFSLFINQ